MRAVTNTAALLASPEIAATSLAIAAAGAAGAKRRAAVDTGRMRDSINAFPMPRGRARWGTKIPHAKFNEFGTIKMRARPFVRPSADDAGQVLR